MTGDPLYRPLGMEPQTVRRWSNRRIVQVGAAAVLLAGVGSAAAIVVQLRQAGERRIAVAPIEVTRPSKTASQPSPSTIAPPMAVVAAVPDPAPTGTLSGTSIEVQNGVKIIRFNGGTSAASVTIPVADGETAALAPAPDPRVSEKTADGTLPRIGPMGARASAVYARHDPAANSPRVAIVLLGLGQDQLLTADAARRLAPATGFGFAPEVSDATTQVAEARRLGHEAYLDLRQAGADAAASSDPARALRRRLGRWSGYVGVVLDPGASPTSAEEAGRRGLFSVAITPGPGLAVTRLIDVMTDAGQGQATLDAALARLVDIAKAKGSALGVIDHAARGGAGLTAALEAFGTPSVTLVPASALLAAPGGAVDASR